MEDPARDPGRIGIGEALLALWRLSRPEAWMVTFLPVYGGWLLASRQIALGFALWAGFFDRAARPRE